MRIAVTGASGFIGTELLGVLTGDNAEITALTRGNSGDLASPCCVWKQTDYSEDSLTGVLRGVDAVVHLAGVRGTTSNPDDYVVNEEMTGALLRAMRNSGVKRIVFASTISVYDDEDLIPWKESSPLRGRTMYGASKINCEEMIRSRAAEFGYTYAIVRIAQVLGMGERRRGMMNVFIDTAKAGGEIRVIGRSAAKRQYLYVKDLAEILAGLAEGRLADAGPSDMENITVNAGMPRAYTNLEIAQIVNRVYGNETPISYDDSQAETIRPSFMDISRLADRLGFKTMDMEQALEDLRQEADR